MPALYSKFSWFHACIYDYFHCDVQHRTQGFLLPRLEGQRKRPWLRLVCFATWLVNDFEWNYSIYVRIIIIMVEREWSDKFIIISKGLKYRVNKIFWHFAWDTQHELGKDNRLHHKTSWSICTFCIDEYLLRFNHMVQHTFLVISHIRRLYIVDFKKRTPL